MTNNFFFYIYLSTFFFLTISFILAKITKLNFTVNIIAAFALEIIFNIIIYLNNNLLEQLYIILFTTLLIKIIFYIYIPLATERSFSLMILFKLKNKKLKLEDFHKKNIYNYMKIINVRLKFFLKKEYIKKYKNLILLTKKGKLVLDFYKFFKKIYKIKNNNII